LAKLSAELIDRANAAGGPDNITVALIRRTE
jgi:serine/threonine protein phosphatase PrpC